MKCERCKQDVNITRHTREQCLEFRLDATDKRVTVLEGTVRELARRAGLVRIGNLTVCGCRVEGEITLLCEAHAINNLLDSIPRN